MQERGARLNIAFEPLHNNFGVEVSGADLTKPLSDEEKMLLQASHALQQSLATCWVIAAWCLEHLKLACRVLPLSVQQAVCAF